MKNIVNFSLLCFFYSINSVFCDDFKCPKSGKVGKLKVPNVLSLIDKQNGYHASVEVIHPNRKKLINDYYDLQNKVGFIDLEVTIQDKMNRRYYYHSTEEKMAVREDVCTRLELSENEKIKSIKDWFEPTNIVANSELFKDLVHLEPTRLMIYAHNISDEASFIGSEVIEGRSVNHWFYCTNPNGPYIDFYFDVKTSLPYRFSLYYPKWMETREVISMNQTQTVKKQVDYKSKYVYNFYMFKPLVISAADPIPYPLGYGCPRKGTSPSIPLPDFGKAEEFYMDMEAIITYSDSDPVKSFARVMKRDDIISIEIKERNDSVRFVEMPPPLGRFEIDEKTGKCSYSTSYNLIYETIMTFWPLHEDDFNLLNYLLMKPTAYRGPIFIGEIPLGPFRVEEYRASNFFSGNVDAFVDYYYTKNTSNSVPSKIIFTKDRSNYFYNFYYGPTQVEVIIINYEIDSIDYKDQFDVSGCYQEPGSYTWFQLLFSNPWISGFNMQSIKKSTEKYLAKFIPITRIGPIHSKAVDSNIYVTVKLYDRVHFIDAYSRLYDYTIMNPSNIVKRYKVEDCEQLCSATERCLDFSYCTNFDCLILETTSSALSSFLRQDNCIVYSGQKSRFDITSLVSKNYLSNMSHLLQQIRNKVSSGDFRMPIQLVAEDLFIVNGPEEVGDISQEMYESGSSRPLRAEDFPIIKTDRQFNVAQFKVEKSTLQDCFMACLNDDDCNSLSYCVYQNEECILSGETSSSFKDTLDDKTSHADGCNIYQKSFINLFDEYPGKNLVQDAISTTFDVSIVDCASTCAQSSSFSCESFDYCENNENRNQSLCFLHVNHIEIDKTREINITNWKFAEAGCSHYSKKSELDYEHKVGLKLKDNMKESIVGTFDHLSLDHFASKCSSNRDCFTLEYCETIDFNQITDESVSLSSCTLSNLKPSSVNQSQLFEKPTTDKNLCSIYVNHKKIIRESKTDSHSSESLTSTKSNDFTYIIGLSTIVFILAFASGFSGFKFAVRKGFILRTIY